MESHSGFVFNHKKTTEKKSRLHTADVLSTKRPEKFK